MSNLNDEELKRALQGVSSAFLVPFIDDVEDFVWESIWHDVKGIPAPNRLARSKRLFDVVNNQTREGWSAKTLKIPGNLIEGKEYEFVIQRADVIKKQELLGFSDLSVQESDPQTLGNAVLTHWRMKVEHDAQFQGVEDPKTAVLLKNEKRTSFIIIEEELSLPNNSEIEWNWTNESKVGLQGRNIQRNRIQFRWYPNQTQLFERNVIPQNPTRFNIVPNEIQPAELRELFRKAGYIS